MTFNAGNEFRVKPGELKNGLGRPKTARIIKKDAAKALRVAAGPLVDLAISKALEGSEPALCAVLNLLASGFREHQAKRVEAVDATPIVG